MKRVLLAAMVVAARLVGSLDCVTASLRPGLPRWMRSRIAAM
jgi:hypothetical protein